MLPAAFFALLAAVLIACGGGGDDDATPNGGSSSTDGTPAGTLTPAESPTPTPESPLATPTRVADDEPVMAVNSGPMELFPTVAELGALPQTEVTGSDGNSYTGTTLAVLGEQVSAPAQGFVSIQGIRSDGIRYATVRFAIEEHAGTTVVFVGESGNVEMASSSIAAANWVGAISAISYQ
jgi:hypothetical protein